MMEYLSIKQTSEKSATHILPHTIIEAGYEIVNVDLIGKSVELKKNK